MVPTADPIATADDVGLVRGGRLLRRDAGARRSSDAVVENLDDHLVRFAASAATLDLSFDPDAWRALIADAAAA